MTNDKELKAVREARAYNERDIKDCNYLIDILSDECKGRKEAIEGLEHLKTIQTALTAYEEKLASDTITVKRGDVPKWAISTIDVSANVLMDEGYVNLAPQLKQVYDLLTEGKNDEDSD